MKQTKQLFSLLFLSTLSACGGSGVEVRETPQITPPPVEACVTTPESFQTAELQNNLFNLGSDYPSDLKFTPNGEALATLSFNPVSVIFLNPANPTQVHPNYPVFDASAIPEAAFPSQMIFDADSTHSQRGYFLSSSHLIGFDAATGEHLFSQPLTSPIALEEDLFYSQPCDCEPFGGDGIIEDSVSGSMMPSYPASLAIVGNRLFVTLSNLYFDASFESYYLPGVVLAFDLLPEAPYIQAAATPHLFLPGYNASGITSLSESLLITLSGDATFASGDYEPQTNSALVEVDPETLSLNGSLNLGYLAANFRPLAVNQEETLGYLGSAAFPQVVEIDFSNFQVSRILNLSEATSGYVADQKLLPGETVLAAASYNEDLIHGVDLTQPGLALLLPPLDISFPENPGLTGISALAVSPSAQSGGLSGGQCSYDLYTLTSTPGSVGAVTAHQ